MAQSEKDENRTSFPVHFAEAELIGSKFGEFEF
jgi:hypothetical protein